MDWSVFNTKQYWNKRIKICKLFNRVEIYNYTISPATKTIHRECSKMTKDLRETKKLFCGRKVYDGGMIIKTGEIVWIYEWPENYLRHKKNVYLYGYRLGRLSSDMTKDLIKHEIRNRALSFRPSANQCYFNQIAKKYTYKW